MSSQVDHTSVLKNSAPGGLLLHSEVGAPATRNAVAAGFFATATAILDMSHTQLKSVPRPHLSSTNASAERSALRSATSTEPTPGHSSNATLCSASFTVR